MTRMKKNRKAKQKKFLDGRIHKGNFLGAVVDNINNQIRVYSNDMLQKRIQRDSFVIGKSFDKLCGDELVQMGELFSKTTYLISNGFFRASHDEDRVKETCSKLLMNAISTIQASVELLRIGYTLQPCMLLRSAIETISTIAYFMMESNGYQVYLDGKLDVNKTIKYGKQLIPNLGQLQGLLSNHFVHISSLHSDLNGITKHTEITPPLTINLNMIKICIWCLFVTSELAFYDYFDTHKYWTKISDNEYKFEHNEEDREWISQFFKDEDSLSM
ncbi:hypothetical protein GC096_02240 [Paenibacillus sp. LMG 31461]|uniref:Uncharacterized protein n=1 Tax=Paenibacillus plantarum TaxID=2654975 RepID=A0ABX1X3M5_9BACL|nr:hypothetical protein [Paenibacillus plantarum]NOU62867.1 hypothetical protein [Paenibacillus plantarum]